MRHQLRWIEKISRVLAKEACAREGGRVSTKSLHLIQKETGFSIRLARCPAWTLVVIGTKRQRMIEEKLWITVYFGSMRTDAKPSSRTNATTRAIRNAFRNRTFPVDMEPFSFADKLPGRKGAVITFTPGEESRIHRYKTLVIDAKTKEKVIAEMIAVCLIQVGFADESVWNSIAHDLRKEDRSEFAVMLSQFVDPAWPASYSAYRRIRKREFIRRGQKRFAEILMDKEDIMEAEVENNGLDKRAKPRKPPTDLERDISKSEMPIIKAAAELGISQRTLYQMIRDKKVHVIVDQRGVLQIQPAEFLRLEQHFDEEKRWKACVELRARITSRRSAQRWVQRKRAGGVNAMALFRSLEETIGILEQDL